MIVRSARPIDNFTIISNDIINDSRLTWKARGILIFVLSKPDGWRTNAAGLGQYGIDGRDAILSGLNELERAGYIRRVKERHPDGKITTHTIVFDRPRESHFEVEIPTCE